MEHEDKWSLTRDRSMTETQRLVWLMAHPVCAEVNNAMQQLTGVQYNTSEQHKDLTMARQGKDMADSCELLYYSFLNLETHSVTTAVCEALRRESMLASVYTWTPHKM